MNKIIADLQAKQKDLLNEREQANTGVVNTKVWMSDGGDYLYPEQSLANPPAQTAICFSGGGTRALSATMGQLRALNSIGTLQGAGYISCVSGGSWASVAYTFYQSGPGNDDELLGPVIAPDKITATGLQDLPATRLAIGAATDFWHYLKNKLEGSLTGKVDPHRAWIEAVGEVFMQPFGLYQDGSAQPFFTLNDSTENDIKSRNQHNAFVNNNTFIQPHANRPFLVVNSSLLWPDNLVDPQLTSFEYTPLAVGSPHLLELEDKVVVDWGKRIVGGGLLEPFAYGCGSPGSQLEGKGKGEYTLDLQAPTSPYGVTDASGTSSAAYSADFAEMTTVLSPEMPYWPVTTQGNTNDETKERVTYFGDGGSLENMGLISVLRRGVKSAIVFVNTPTVLQEGYSGDAWPDHKDPQIDTDFAKLFGYDPQKNAYNNRVFTQDDFKSVVQTMQSNRAKGEPLVAWGNYTVQANSNWGIKGGNSVFIVWVYLGRCANWEDALPTATRDWMNIGGDGQFKDFPNYKTIGQNWHGLEFRLVQLTKPQINALADLTCWSCQQFLGHPEVVAGLGMHS